MYFITDIAKTEVYEHVLWLELLILTSLKILFCFAKDEIKA